ncbi:MAG TPA: hypothetical protein VLF65_05270 [Burkholderiales bacterium]|jgi:hypothetical protein|nr:hypothetical protein [Burkholderiales bacterium]
MEQQTYARWVDIGTRIGFGVLFLTFLVYVLGVLEPLVPPQELSPLWGLAVDRYVSAAGAPTGWGWIALAAKADYLNYIGVALLASVTLAAYARIVPVLLANGERLRAAIAALQVLVLIVAAVL